MSTRLRRTAADERAGFTVAEVLYLADAWRQAGIPGDTTVRAAVTMRGRLRALEVEHDPAPRPSNTPPDLRLETDLGL